MLGAVMTTAGPNFAGLGIVVSDDLSSLPTVALVRGWRAVSEPLEYTLSRISRYENPFHDGFHIVSSSGELRAVSQYFSPPIQPRFWSPTNPGHGGRYAAALFGSVLPNVVLTAAVSAHYGIAMFVAGKEIA